MNWFSLHVAMFQPRIFASISTKIMNCHCFYKALQNNLKLRELLIQTAISDLVTSLQALIASLIDRMISLADMSLVQRGQIIFENASSYF